MRRPDAPGASFRALILLGFTVTAWVIVCDSPVGAAVQPAKSPDYAEIA